MKSVPSRMGSTAHIVQPLSHHERLARIERLAGLMDEAFQIPGTNIRVGMDSLIGLIPGIGDVATAVVSGLIIHQARQMGIPKRTLMRMLSNVGVDLVVGAVPVAGDLFDVVWKSNRKNVALLKKHLAKQAKRG